MTDDNKNSTCSFGLIGIFIFLGFLWMYNGNNSLAEIQLYMIFFSLLWTSLVILGVAVIIGIIAAVFS